MKKSIIGAMVIALIVLACPSPEPEFEVTNSPCTIAQNECVVFPNGRCGVCADPNAKDASRLCSYLPRAQDVTTSVGYAGLTTQCQRPFDWYSWQLFIALNWPINPETGEASKEPIGSHPDWPRYWETFPSKGEVFPDYKDSLSLEFLTNIKGELVSSTPRRVQSSKYGQGAGQLEAFSDKPIIDKDLNFVLYTIHVNDIEKNYIEKNKLNTWCGQKKLGNQPADFPAGSIAEDSLGAIEIKAAWRIVSDEFHDTDIRQHTTKNGHTAYTYYYRRALLNVPACYSTTNNAFTDTVWLALIGMHSISRNNTDAGTDWIWTSFEHDQNSPLCEEVEVLQNKNTAGEAYAFYNPDCKDCKLNTPPEAKDSVAGCMQKNIFQWTPRESPSSPPQFAKAYATDGKYGTQICRVFPIESSTQAINATWKNLKELDVSTFKRFHLIGSQWNSPTEAGAPPGVNAAPKMQSNTVIETYTQTPESVTPILPGYPIGGSCVACHSFATLATNNKPLSGNFSFLLGSVTKPADDCE